MTAAVFAQGSLFANLPGGGGHEHFTTLADNGATRIERIVSHGQASAPDFWYDQNEDEFVLVVSGHATLRIEGRADLVRLGPGDWVNLPAHCRHRVEATSVDPPTVWLACFASRGTTSEPGA